MAAVELAIQHAASLPYQTGAQHAAAPTDWQDRVAGSVRDEDVGLSVMAWECGEAGRKGQDVRE